MCKIDREERVIGEVTEGTEGADNDMQNSKPSTSVENENRGQ